MSIATYNLTVRCTGGGEALPGATVEARLTRPDYTADGGNFPVSQRVTADENGIAVLPLVSNLVGTQNSRYTVVVRTATGQFLDSREIQMPEADSTLAQLVEELPVNTDTQTAAAISADLAEAWATGTEPGGAGTQSSREWAGDAEAEAGNAATSATEAGNAESGALAAESGAVDAETASADSAALSEAWATGTEPGGVGTKSAREEAERAEAAADELPDTAGASDLDSIVWSEDAQALQVTPSVAAQLLAKEVRRGTEPVLLHHFANDAHHVVNPDDGSGLKLDLPKIWTFSRNSTVNGWTLDADGNPVLTEFAIDEPAFVVDPATGRSLGYRALKGFTNSLLWNRDLSDGVWSGSATIAQDAVGLDGVANTAWTVTENDNEGISSYVQTISIPDDTSVHTIVSYYKKDENETRFPDLWVRMSGGTDDLSYSLQINTKTGDFAKRLDLAGQDARVESKGEWWRLVVKVENNASGNTGLRVSVRPALGSSLDSVDESATGSIVYDFGGVYLNSENAGPPIETQAEPVSTAPDNATEVLPESVRTRGTLIVNARTAKGTSGDQVLVQADDGTEGNRVRVTRNVSQEVRFIVTTGGTDVVNLNLGTVADDADTKVAIRYGTDDYAGIITGGTLQTETTGAMPSIDTLRHGRDTSGAEWNGAIAQLQGRDAYTDAQLKGAV